MHISRVYIRHFRNLPELDITLGDRTTCFVGPNASGKSNFISAVRLCLDQEYGARRRLTEQDFFNRCGPPKAEHVLISVEFDAVTSSEERAFLGKAMISGHTDKARITYRFRPSQKTRDAIRDSLKDPNPLTLADYEYQLVGGGDRDPRDIAWNDLYGTGGFSPSDLQYFQLVSIPALRDAPRDMKNQRLSPLQRLLDQLPVTEDEKAALIHELQEANERIRSHAVIKRVEADVSSSYNAVF